MTKIWYDCEFLENGKTIELISIGLVAEDGTEYYAVSGEAPLDKIQQHEWLMDNVVPHLPVALVAPGGNVSLALTWNRLHPDQDRILPTWRIRDDVSAFIREKTSPELWAWYAAYDHVALCQLFGRMIDLPVGMPMWTNDLKTICELVGNPQVPKQVENEHHALYDARHDMEIDQYLEQHATLGPLSGALTMSISSRTLTAMPHTDLLVKVKEDLPAGKAVIIRYVQAGRS